MGTIAFLGGWQIPFVAPESINSLGMELLSLLFFFAKTLCLVFVIIQLRWTLPRVRVDQMMTMCWKYLVPITFACNMLVILWMWVRPWEATASTVLRSIMSLGGLLVLGAYMARVRFNIRQAKDKVYIKFAV